MNRITLLLSSTLILLLAGCGGGMGAPDIGDLSGNSAGGSQAPPPPPGEAGEMDAGEYEFAREVFDLTNQERTSRGLAPLTWHEGAAQVAYEHSVYQRGEGCISHTGEGGTQPWDRLTNAGIAWQTAGENVAVGFTTPAALVGAWMDSPGHRANILNESFTHLGVGIEAGAGARSCPDTGHHYQGPWATQAFFRPQ